MDFQSLLSKARPTFDSVHLECTYDADPELIRRAWTRGAKKRAESDENSGFSIEFRSQTGQAAGIQRFTNSRIWYRKPNCWRLEIVSSTNGTDVQIVCNQESSYYLSWLRTLTTTRRPAVSADEFTSAFTDVLVPDSIFVPDRRTAEELVRDTVLLSPPFGDDGWDIQAMGQTMHHGKDALLMKAKWIGEGQAPTKWKSVDDYRLIVDSERGVLLRCEGIVDDQPAVVVDASAIEFDLPIPDSIFSFEPPPGTRIVWARPSRPSS
jgi:outer membrane lipoprotein-sorting protein